MLCIEANGKGDVTDSKIIWSQKKGIGSKPSQVLVQGKLFSVTDDGVFARIDITNGEIAWQKRLAETSVRRWWPPRTHFRFRP